MAISRVDDIDGTAPAEAVPFSLDGHDYVIDLSAANKAALAMALDPFVQAATEVRSRRAAKPRAPKRTDLVEVRAWATEQGIEVNARGRVSAEVLAAYDARDAA